MEHVIDAKGKKLGRLASEVAVLLQGKHKPSYQQNASGEDVVIVKNAGQVVVSGRKAEQKIYYSHTTQIGHLKKRKYADVFEKNPTWVIRHAVNLMLPNNKLRAKRIKRLKFK